jgi:hypothetical protein
MKKPRQKSLRQALEDHAPWKPPKWDEADAGALQALAKGEADEIAQKRALDFFINRLCGTYDMHYRPGTEGQRDTDFALGRAFPGQQIRKLLIVNLSALRRKEK